MLNCGKYKHINNTIKAHKQAINQHNTQTITQTQNKLINQIVSISKQNKNYNSYQNTTSIQTNSQHNPTIKQLNKPQTQKPNHNKIQSKHKHQQPNTHKNP